MGRWELKKNTAANYTDPVSVEEIKEHYRQLAKQLHLCREAKIKKKVSWFGLER